MADSFGGKESPDNTVGLHFPASFTLKIATALYNDTLEQRGQTSKAEIMCQVMPRRNPKDKEMLFLNKARTTHVQSCLFLCVIAILFYDTLCFLEVFLLCVWLPPFHQVAVLVKLSALWESTRVL